MRKDHKILLGVYPLVTNISATIYYKLHNFLHVPDQNLDNFLFIFYLMCKLSYLNIHTY